MVIRMSMIIQTRNSLSKRLFLSSDSFILLNEQYHHHHWKSFSCCFNITSKSQYSTKVNGRVPSTILDLLKDGKDSDSLESHIASFIVRYPILMSSDIKRRDTYFDYTKYKNVGFWSQLFKIPSQRFAHALKVGTIINGISNDKNFFPKGIVEGANATVPLLFNTVDRLNKNINRVTIQNDESSGEKTYDEDSKFTVSLNTIMTANLSDALTQFHQYSNQKLGINIKLHFHVSNPSMTTPSGLSLTSFDRKLDCMDTTLSANKIVHIEDGYVVYRELPSGHLLKSIFGDQQHVSSSCFYNGNDDGNSDDNRENRNSKTPEKNTLIVGVDIVTPIELTTTITKKNEPDVIFFQSKSKRLLDYRFETTPVKFSFVESKSNDNMKTVEFDSNTEFQWRFADVDRFLINRRIQEIQKFQYSSSS